MANISNFELQQIAVDCATSFFNDGTPLNDSLAKQASAMELNADQLKRAIEATNTLTYLKSAQISDKRTSEFEVADYDQILSRVSIPESIRGGQEKSASAASNQTEEYSFDKEVQLAKQAMAFELPELQPGEADVVLMKTAARLNLVLRQAEDDVVKFGTEFVKIANEVKNDPQLLEKLSVSKASDEEFEKIAKLFFEEPVSRLTHFQGIFKSAQVSKMDDLVDFYQKTNSAVEMVNKLKPKSEGFNSLEKKAFLGGIRSLGSAFKSPFRAYSSAESKTTGKAGEAVGRKIGKAVDRSILAVGKSIGPVVGATKDVLHTSLKRSMSTGTTNTKVAKGALAKPKASTVIGAGLVGGALDATAFTPTVNPAADRSGKVWDALN